MNDEKKREARRAYKREWNRRNPDKVRDSQKRYFERRVMRAAEDLLRRTAETCNAGETDNAL